MHQEDQLDKIASQPQASEALREMVLTVIVHEASLDILSFGAGEFEMSGIATLAVDHFKAPGLGSGGQNSNGSFTNHWQGRPTWLAIHEVPLLGVLLST